MQPWSSPDSVEGTTIGRGVEAPARVGPTAAASPRVKVFYVLYVPDGEIRACIDTIRFFIDPDQKWRAHITVRGPYELGADVSQLDQYLEGNEVYVLGVDQFSGKNQCTVFLRCDGTKLRQVWDKPDYPYNPHITLYDGDSREVAEELIRVVGEYHYRLRFRCDRLQPLISVKGAINTELSSSYDPWYMARILGEYIPSSVVRTLPLDTRLKFIDRISCHLAGLTEDSTQ